MLTGKVVQFDDVRGYGFIAPDKGGEDVFVHVNVLGDDRYIFGPGLPVEFEEANSDRGPKAISVRIIEKPAEKSGSSPWAVSPISTPPAPAVPALPRPTPPADAPAATVSSSPEPAEPTGNPATDTQDYDLCDVLTAPDFRHEVIEQLLDSVPTLTGAQITALCTSFLTIAQKYNWVEN